MARQKKDIPMPKGRPPATTPEARERQLVSLATDLAEKQMVAGTASPTVVTHYLKLGSTLYNLEKEKLENENRLLSARVEALQSQAKMEIIYEEALRAMRAYSGQLDSEEDYYDD